MPDIGVLKTLVPDQDQLMILTQLPGFDEKTFLYFLGQYLSRDVDSTVRPSRQELVKEFIELYLLFPYGEGLREWLINTTIPNKLLLRYRSYGVTPAEAEQLFQRGIMSADAIENEVPND